jgi:hypothetical protein
MISFSYWVAVAVIFGRGPDALGLAKPLGAGKLG